MCTRARGAQSAHNVDCASSGNSSSIAHSARLADLSGPTRAGRRTDINCGRSLGAIELRVFVLMFLFVDCLVDVVSNCLFTYLCVERSIERRPKSRRPNLYRTAAAALRAARCSPGRVSRQSDAHRRRDKIDVCARRERTECACTLSLPSPPPPLPLPLLLLRQIDVGDNLTNSWLRYSRRRRVESAAHAHTSSVNFAARAHTHTHCHMLRCWQQPVAVASAML